MRAGLKEIGQIRFDPLNSPNPRSKKGITLRLLFANEIPGRHGSRSDSLAIKTAAFSDGLFSPGYCSGVGVGVDGGAG